MSPNATPNGARPLLVVRTMCTTCKEWQPCHCYAAVRDGHARQAAFDAEDARADAARTAAQQAQKAQTAARAARQGRVRPTETQTPQART